MSLENTASITASWEKLEKELSDQAVLGLPSHIISDYALSGEKMYETLLTNEECAKAIDLGGFYRVPADNRGLNYDKYFRDSDARRNTLTEFNSNNTKLLNKEEIREKLLELAYIREWLAEE